MLRFPILKEIKQMQASGYTVYKVQGEGARGIRRRHQEPGNLKIEVIANAEVAHRILEHVAEHYFDNYAMIAFLDDVEVLQGEKFGATPLCPQ